MLCFEGENEGRTPKPEKERRNERSFVKSLKKRYKWRMHLFVDVNGWQPLCSYCKQGLYSQILDVIYFKTMWSFNFARVKVG